MPDTTILSDYIRFQLSSLNSKNKHHDFEEMCYQFARLVISPNFLPATGPVSSGGDQGRDAETFNSAIIQMPLFTAPWLLADGRSAVIACSLEKKFKQKIESDINTICKSNKPDSIYAFSNQDIPVSIRHKLQGWAKENFEVQLEIFDNAAISDQLTRNEIFWIAQKYLGIPAEMYPRFQIAGNEKYDIFWNKWVREKKLPQTYADFSEVKYCVRHATFSDYKKVDITQWIDVLSNFSIAGSATKILRRCKYEIAVAALRGLGNLDPYTHLVEEYFDGICDLETPQEIEDAVVLLSYCSSAVIMHHFNYDSKKIYLWTVSIIAQIETLLKIELNTGYKCELLAHRAYASTLPFQRGLQPFIDWTAAFKWWNRLLSEVKTAPLFPLERFSKLITSLIPMIGDEPGYKKLTERIDELLSVRSHGFIAADQCRDRALAFIEQSRPIRAIQELHNAKIKWFAKETLSETVLSILLLSRLYGDLHLVWAAKYYALAAAYLIHKNSDDKLDRHFPTALIHLFNTCYRGGEWLTCINLLPLVCSAHYQYRSSPTDYEKYEDFESVFRHSIMIFQSNKRIGNTEIEAHFRKTLSDWPLPDSLSDIILEDSISKSIWVANEEVDQLWKAIDDQLDGVPFSDVGAERSFEWLALGIKWQITCKNLTRTVETVESFVSCLQIVIVDLADIDCILIPSTIFIDAICSAHSEFEFNEAEGNEGSNWSLHIPLESSNAELDTWAMAFATFLITSCSLLPDEKCKKIFDKAIKNGLFSKTFFVRPYHELLRAFASTETENVCTTLRQPISPANICLHEARSLIWKTGPGPGYTKKKSLEIIERRYVKCHLLVRYSLMTLKNNPVFSEFVLSLRDQGYLDWHILLLLANMATNKRNPVPNDYFAGSEEYNSKFLGQFENGEKEEDILLTEEDFSPLATSMQLKMQLASVCNTWGLVYKSRTPDFESLRKVLAERYNHFSDDVLHEELFA